MQERITTIQVRERLGDILDRVALRHDRFVVERKGRPLAAIVPVEELDRMREAARLHLAGTLRAVSRKRRAVSDKEALRLADEATHRTRSGNKAR